MLRPGTRVTTAGGYEFELVCRAKCGGLKGWMANPCWNRDRRADRDHEHFLADVEILGVLTKRGQYMMQMEEEEA